MSDIVTSHPVSASVETAVDLNTLEVKKLIEATDVSNELLERIQQQLSLVTEIQLSPNERLD